MAYREKIPVAALAPYVDRFWSTDTLEDAGGAPTRVLPDGCIDVHVLVDHPARPVAVVGTMSKAIVLEEAVRSRIAAVRFRPGGATPFLAAGAAELTDRRVPLIDLGPAARRFEERIAQRSRSCFGVTDALTVLEATLLERLASIVPVDGSVRRAVARLFGRSPPRVEALADEIGCSRQHLARAFQRHVGVSPKAFARIARLQRALTELQRASIPPLASLALDLGYFDQAHLARDFREIAGLSPRAARLGAGSVFPIASLLGDLDRWHGKALRNAGPACPHAQPHRRGHRGLPRFLDRSPRLREDGRGAARRSPRLRDPRQ